METAGFLFTTPSQVPVEGAPQAAVSVQAPISHTSQHQGLGPDNKGFEQFLARYINQQPLNLGTTQSPPAVAPPVLLSFNQQPLNTVPLAANAGKGLQLGGELLPGIAPQAMAGWVVDEDGLNKLAESLPEGLTLDDVLATASVQGALPAELAQQVGWHTPAGVATQLQNQAGQSETLLPASSAQALNGALPPLQSQQPQQLAQASAAVEQAQGPQATVASSESLSTVVSQAERQIIQPGVTPAVQNPVVVVPPIAANPASMAQANTAQQSSNSLAALQGLAKASGVKEGMPLQAASVAESVEQANSLAPGVTAFPRVEGASSYQQMVAPQFQTSIATQVTAQGWGDTVMQRVMWMSSQHVRSAEIQLDPPELGSLMVKIQTINDQTSVNFTSPHAVVRDTLDQNLPRLRELMAEQGVDLVDVDVSEHSRQDRANEGEQDGGSASGQRELLADETAAETQGASTTESVELAVSQGIISTYA